MTISVLPDRPGIVVFLTLFASATWACAAPLAPRFDGFPLARFDRVTEDVYRASQPNPETMKALIERYRIRSVLKLNQRQPETLPAGVTLINEPIGTRTALTPERIQRILDAIEQAPKPILIHCTHGEDRTGLIVALYRVRHGMSFAAAHRDMLAHGFHPYPALWQVWERVKDCRERGKPPAACN